MKKSSQITLGLVAATAMAFTSACHKKTQTQTCVDAENRIVADSWCEDAEQKRRTNPGGFYPHVWIFGGSSGGRIGDTVFGGSAVPTPGVSITRGGFGASMHTSAGGAGHGSTGASS
jgi:hypothetical protein